jgi:hypothetical protein
VAKTKKLASRYRSQVKAETRLRYGPERRQVRSEVGQAKRVRDSEIDAAHTTARIVQDAVDRVEPKITGNNADAAKVVQETAGMLADRLKGLSPAADAIKAASARDSAGAERRLGERLASTKDELAMRKVDAATAAVTGEQAARGRFRQTRKALSDRLSGINREAGVFAQARSGELDESRRERKQKAKDRTSRERIAEAGIESREKISAADRASREKVAAQKEKATSKPKATPKEVGSFRTKLDTALGDVQILKGEDRSRNEAQGILRTGRKPMTLKVDAEGNPLAAPVQIPGVGRMKDSLATQIALDVKYDGAISQAAQRKLRNLGINPRSLGHPLAPGRKQKDRARMTPGPNGQTRPN